MDTLRNTVRALKALSDPGRLKILFMLKERPLCVCEITAVLGLSQPAVSRHLKILEDADLLRSERDGVWINYRMAGAEERGNPVVRELLEGIFAHLGDDPDIRDALGRAKKVDREDLAG
jgi:ArsR family transcriptional regulator